MNWYFGSELITWWKLALFRGPTGADSGSGNKNDKENTCLLFHDHHLLAIALPILLPRVSVWQGPLWRPSPTAEALAPWRFQAGHQGATSRKGYFASRVHHIWPHPKSSSGGSQQFSLQQGKVLLQCLSSFDRISPHYRLRVVSACMHQCQAFLWHFCRRPAFCQILPCGGRKRCRLAR